MFKTARSKWSQLSIEMSLKRLCRSCILFLWHRNGRFRCKHKIDEFGSLTVVCADFETALTLQRTEIKKTHGIYAIHEKLKRCIKIKLAWDAYVCILNTEKVLIWRILSRCLDRQQSPRHLLRCVFHYWVLRSYWGGHRRALEEQRAQVLTRTNDSEFSLRKLWRHHCKGEEDGEGSVQGRKMERARLGLLRRILRRL